VYAVCEGLFLGGISAILEQKFPFIAAQAAGLTFGTLVIMLTLYKTRVIRVTECFKAGVIAATCAIALLYLVCFVLSFFGKQVPYIHSSGTIGIAFSLFVVGLAALNLLLDFDFIEPGVAAGAPISSGMPVFRCSSRWCGCISNCCGCSPSSAVATELSYVVLHP